MGNTQYLEYELLHALGSIVTAFDLFAYNDITQLSRGIVPYELLVTLNHCEKCEYDVGIYWLRARSKRWMFKKDASEEPCPGARC